MNYCCTNSSAFHFEPDLLLEKNYFKFDNYFYLQTKDVAMGSVFAPSATNLFMARLEDKYIFNADTNPHYKYIDLFYRFIDDCFCIQKDDSTKNTFNEWLNSVHPSIRFTSEGMKTEVNFFGHNCLSDDTEHLGNESF